MFNLEVIYQFLLSDVILISESCNIDTETSRVRKESV